MKEKSVASVPFTRKDIVAAVKAILDEHGCPAHDPLRLEQYILQRMHDATSSAARRRSRKDEQTLSLPNVKKWAEGFVFSIEYLRPSYKTGRKGRFVDRGD